MNKTAIACAAILAVGAIVCVYVATLNSRFVPTSAGNEKVDVTDHKTEKTVLIPPTNATTNPLIGRYAFGKPAEFRWDGYTLDTQSGRFWILYYDTDHVATLRPVLYVSVGSADTPHPHVSFEPLSTEVEGSDWAESLGTSNEGSTNLQSQPR